MNEYNMQRYFRDVKGLLLDPVSNEVIKDNIANLELGLLPAY
jgi:hypothetical protein